ncbi:MAG: chemotaxis-specific protein-glutamate methyltransferase CheB [Planctomycetota bacterium]
MTIRVLVVDDSALMRRAITRLIESDPGLEVVGTARDGRDGLAKIARYEPDVVTLDIEMPVMTGIDALKEIGKMPIHDRPVVLMCSSLTVEGSNEALEAMKLGAADYFPKDPDTLRPEVASSDKQGLLAKIHAVGSSRQHRANTALRSMVAPTPPCKPRASANAPSDIALVCIGSSTGGPPVVEKLLESVPAGFPYPIVVAQHMPATFTESLSRRLDGSCKIPVRHGVHRTAIEPGVAVIVQGGAHGRVVRGGGNGVFKLEVGQEPHAAIYRPSVNELFKSASRIAGAGTLGIMLTGMGDDGCVGARHVRDAGGAVYTQSADSCIVYGMPRAVDEAGLSSGCMNPDQLVDFLADIARPGGNARVA